MCRPAVPLEQAMPWRRPARAARPASNRGANGPRASTSLRRTSVDELELALADVGAGERDGPLRQLGRHGWLARATRAAIRRRKSSASPSIVDRSWRCSLYTKLRRSWSFQTCDEIASG